MKKFLAAFMAALLVSLTSVAIVNAAQPNTAPVSATVVMTDADLTVVSGGKWSEYNCKGLKVVAIIGPFFGPGGIACAVSAGLMEAFMC